MPHSSDPATISSLLTAAGRGAVATIAVRGPRAAEAVQSHFQAANGMRLDEAELGRILFGQFRSLAEITEDLVVCRTAPDEVEIHCHGGQAAAQAVLKSLAAANVRSVAWDEWLATTQTDIIAAEALLALSQAATERTAAILLDQYRGALRREIEWIIEALPQDAISRGGDALGRLHARIRLGEHLIAPFRVVLAGRPNVGKSSLINALCGYNRSIVSPQAGTTRDVVTAETVLDCWPIELSDTAGLRDSADELESAGIQQARTQMENGDLLVLIAEHSTAWGPEEADHHLEYPGALVVYNKGDLPPAPADDRPKGLVVSAHTGMGLEALQQAIVKQLVPSPLELGEAVPFSERQISLLLRAIHLPSERRAALKQIVANE